MEPELPQTRLIASVREKCDRDGRVDAALMYGSFAKREGDRYSDVEFYVFVRDEELPAFDRQEWVGEIAPVFAFFVNEFGTQVAIFDDLIRGEFHFEPHSAVRQVRRWTPIEKPSSPDAMLVLDRVGELTIILGGLQRAELTSQGVQELYDRFVNWFLLGCNVIQRGERARSLDALSHMHTFLLQLARARAGALDHWLTPSRNVERELSAADCGDFGGCTADLSPGSIERAYQNSWAWSQGLIRDLGESWDVDPRPALVAEVDRRLAEWLSR